MRRHGRLKNKSSSDCLVNKVMKTITITLNNLETEIEYFDDGESPVLFSIESVKILGADFPLDDLSAAGIDKIRGLICKELEK